MHGKDLNKSDQMGSDETSDDHIIQMVKNGDKKAFGLLVRRHQKALLRMCVRLMRDATAAEDIVQESFIKAFEKIHSFEGRSSFKSWLFQIAVNTTKNKWRSHREDAVDHEQMPQMSEAATAEKDLIKNAVAQLIAEAIETLPFRQKTALTLRIYEDLSFKEIADIMQCPYDTAKANFRHALLKLKEQFQHDEEMAQYFTEHEPEVSTANDINAI